MYFVKQTIAALGTPLILALLIAAAAGIFRLLKRPRTARWLLICATAVGYLGSIAIMGDAMLRPLERRYPPFRASQTRTKVSYIVVLGSGYNPRDEIPVTAALDPDGLVRVVEGVRLALSLGGVKLVVSGGAPPGSVPPAHGYAELARGLGIGADALVVLDTALDTGAEARAVAALVGTEPFILVTSAYHMPRAMQQMKRAGVRPTPAPTGQLTQGSDMGDWRRWFPSSGGLGKNERALHEYLGLAALAVGVG